MKFGDVLRMDDVSKEMWNRTLDAFEPKLEELIDGEVGSRLETRILVSDEFRGKRYRLTFRVSLEAEEID